MGVLRQSAVLAAVRSCLQRDRSPVLRTYAIVALVVSIFALVLLLLALPTWMAHPSGTSALLMLAPGLLALGGLAVIAALVAPVLLAHRRVPDPGAEPTTEFVYGLFGYAVVVALYAALIISAPEGARGDPPSGLEPLIEPLYGLHPLVGIVPPVVVVGLLLLVDRRFVTA